jgi:hypothetical protein
LCARCLLGVCLASGAFAVAAPLTPDVSGGPYVLKSTRIAGGGGTVAGGTYALNGSVGQHDATVVSAQGGNYDLDGGLHPGPAAPAGPSDAVFASGFE